MKPICMLGMDIGGTNIRMGLVDEAYRLYHFARIPTRSLQQPDGRLPVERLADSIEAYWQTHREAFEIAGISIGFPSTIDKSRRVILSTPNIPGLDQIPIADQLEARFSLPAYINRDVNMLFAYDRYRFEIPDRCVALGCYMGTGFGNAIYVHGEILLGKNGVAGELGHIPMAGVHDRCGCGNEGCIELRASGHYLQALTARAFPDTAIDQVFLAHGEHPLIREFIDVLSLPIATEATILDPDYIVLGGGLPQMPGFPLEELKQAVIRHTRKPYPADNLVFLHAASSQEDGVIGAGIDGFAAQAKVSRHE